MSSYPLTEAVVVQEIIIFDVDPNQPTKHSLTVNGIETSGGLASVLSYYVPTYVISSHKEIVCPEGNNNFAYTKSIIILTQKQS